MNATQLFFGLVGLLVVLFGVALAKPYFTPKPVDIQTLKEQLAKLLPHHDFVIKQGSQSRMIVSLDGMQKAIIVMDTPRPQYIMGGLPIFTTNRPKDLTAIAQQIKQLSTTLH